jgi:hypothetical protein
VSPRKSSNCYCKDIIALGDFNLPKTLPGDPIFEALTKRGLHLPQHTSEVGSSIASDNHYKDELVQKKIIPQTTYDTIKDQIIARQK